MAAQAKNSMPRCGMRWAGALRRGPWRAGCALVLTLTPAAAGASTAERVFATVSPSVVVVRAATSQGSGVVVAPQVVATNCHVLREGAQITVQRGRISHTATRLWRDQLRDLCLLQVPTLESPPVTLGEAGRLRVGATVYAVGAPQGLELSLSAGLVSQLRAAEGAPLVQTTAPISPGSSGGGLFDERGRLVGLTTFQMERGQNVNFALPAEWVAAALARASSWLRCRTAPTVACLLAEARDIVGELDLDYSAFLARATVAEAHAQAGDRQGAAQTFAQALAAARSIQERIWLRAKALAAIAQAQARAGDRQGAAQTLTEALAAVRSIEDAFERAILGASALRNIAAAQAQAGDIPGALATARSIEDTRERTEALQGIARAQARAGDISGALATARSIEDANLRVSTLHDIARAQAQAGDITGALATARSLANAKWRASALGSIALAQAEAGDIVGALATARSVEDALQRVFAVAAIAEAQAQAGDRKGAEQTVTEARATARSVVDAASRARALAAIAIAQARAGDRQGAAQTLAEARATARGIEDAWERAWRLQDIAQAQALTGDITGALATARSVEKADSLAWTLRGIAGAQARAGDIAGALAIIDEISDQARRAEALATVAEHLAQRR
jgi:tetratricopeptide (TPR) repeat protein